MVLVSFFIIYDVIFYQFFIYFSLYNLNKYGIFLEFKKDVKKKRKMWIDIVNYFLCEVLILKISFDIIFYKF